MQQDILLQANTCWQAVGVLSFPDDIVSEHLHDLHGRMSSLSLEDDSYRVKSPLASELSI